MYISVRKHIILVIITIESKGEASMKKISVLFITIIFCVGISSCVLVGEKDSTDFFSEMLRHGYTCNVAETQNDKFLKESCYVDKFKLSVFSDVNGKLVRVSLTYSQNDSSGFADLAEDTVSAFCGFDSGQTAAVFSVLGIGDNLPSDSSGVIRCDTQWYGFSFVCDEVGGTLAVENYRLNPTSAPDVTINTTVPFIAFSSSEKTSS